MIYSVLVEAIDSEIEEEVSISVCGHRLVCFASYLPYSLKVGGVYLAELLPMVLNDYMVEEFHGVEPAISREDEGYSYELVGKLRGECLNVGELSFCDEYLLNNFGFLEGKMVAWKIDRLDIFFVYK